MKKIESKLYDIHEQARNTKSVASGDDGYSSKAAKSTDLKPFLTINQVAVGGPANLAVRLTTVHIDTITILSPLIPLINLRNTCRALNQATL